MKDLALIRRVVQGLLMRICVIETGTPHLRASDVHPGTLYDGRKIVVKTLNSEQMALILRLEKLVELFVSASVCKK